MKNIQLISPFLKIIRSNINYFFEWLHDWTKFFFLLILVVIQAIMKQILKLPLIPLPLRLFCYNRILNKVNIFLDNSSSKKYTISKVVLIEMAIKNMKFKKTRTLITVGGMSLGIGAIVFLVSLGFGVQKLVIQRVARLDEMKQSDVVPQTGSKILLSDREYSRIKSFANVDKTLPVISMVGRVAYNNSVSDTPVYGVTSDYLELSAIKPVAGKIYKSNALTLAVRNDTLGDVAGAFTKRENISYMEDAGSVKFSVEPEYWTEVRSSPDIETPIIGYTRSSEGYMQGTIIWGKRYSQFQTAYMNSEKNMEQWIYAGVELWERRNCDSANRSCASNGKYQKITDPEILKSNKYITLSHIKLHSLYSEEPEVLGVSSDSPDVIDISNLVSSSSSNLDLMSLASEAAVVKTEQVKKVSFKGNALKQAVITRAMAKVLGLNDAKAIGKTFDVSFVQTGESLNNSGKIESHPTTYTIVAVIPEATTAYFYVPFIDLRGLGINTYSQMRIVAKNQQALPDIRKRVEALGFNTSSVVDTVNQIDTLFSSVRVVLAALGMVALFVASLGMFNTLTVSLMERTREIGLMRAIGMRSEEIRELFLVESMLMGLFGGIFGLILGIVAGKLAGLLLSIFTVLKGAGFVDVSDLPMTFIFAVLSFSIFVGLITGIYPARRATKISALNALRYE